MERIFITSGKKYIDIDAYAGIFAYRHLLNTLGYEAYAYNKAPLNESISDIITNLGFSFDEVEPTNHDKFIVLDVSNPDFFYDIPKDNILEVIDHHVGFEDYWKNFSNINTHIEFIGSVCTILYEKYKEHKQELQLNEKLCKLLMAGILDNTLNLKAAVTNDRDRKALHELEKLGDIESSWANEYFHSCYDKLENNLEESIKNDIKHEHVSELLPDCIGQLIVLDKKIIFSHLEQIKKIFEKEENWILNMIDLSEGVSYILYGKDEKVKENLEILWNKKADKDYLKLDAVILRKEILKYAREFKKSN